MTEAISLPARTVWTLRWWIVVALRLAGVALLALALLRFGGLLVDAPYRAAAGRGPFPYANLNERPVRDAVTGAVLLGLSGWAARYIVPAPGGPRSRYFARAAIRCAGLALLSVALWKLYPEGREAWRYLNLPRPAASWPRIARAIGRLDTVGPFALLGAALLVAQRSLTLLLAPSRPHGCTNCGYELEDTQQQCPECGFAVARERGDA